MDCPNSALNTRRGVLHIYITSEMHNTDNMYIQYEQYNTVQYNTNTVKYNAIQIIYINLISSKMLLEFFSCKAANTGRKNKKNIGALRYITNFTRLWIYIRLMYNIIISTKSIRSSSESLFGSEKKNIFFRR